MPLAVTVTAAGANDGCQTHKVLAALVVRPPAPEVPTDTPDDRGRPTARADGAYGNGPSRERAASQGFRLQAPSRGKKRPGVGKVRNAVVVVQFGFRTPRFAGNPWANFAKLYHYERGRAVPQLLRPVRAGRAATRPERPELPRVVPIGRLRDLHPIRFCPVVLSDPIRLLMES